MMTQNLTILGSTGSIGRQTLEVVEQFVRVAALTAGQNVSAYRQCRCFRPQLAVMGTGAAQRPVRCWAGEN
ncbi:MAG: hypothetical protein ACLTG4_02625 [Oscillospiraceae bacterium]